MDRIYTGFKEIDAKTIIQKGDLAVIAGRPATGKTALVSTIIKNTLDRQKTLFFTMQFKKSKAIESLVSFAKDKGEKLLIVPQLLGLEDMLMKVGERKLSCGLDVVVIDNFCDFINYLKVSEQFLISKLKQMAKSFGVALIITDYITRKGNNHPSYADVMHREFLMQADVIMSLYPYSKNECDEYSIDYSTVCLSVDKDVRTYDYCSSLITLCKNTKTFVEV